MVFAQNYVLARVATRLENASAKQRASFDSVWEIANDGKLAEHEGKLAQIWEVFYGSPSQDRSIEPQARPVDSRVSWCTRWKFRNGNE